MTVEELNIVISANDRKFNEAIGDVIGRLDDLEEQSRRSTDDIGNFFTNLGHKLAALGIGKIIGDSIMSGGELEQQLGGVEVPTWLPSWALTSRTQWRQSPARRRAILR